MRKLLKRGHFPSLDDLRDQILAFIDYYNCTMAAQANTRLSIQVATAYQLVAMIALWKLCQAGLAEPSNLRSPKKFSMVDLLVPRSWYEYQ